MLPIVSVLANMVHFFLALPIVIRFAALGYRHSPIPAASSGSLSSSCVN